MGAVLVVIGGAAIALPFLFTPAKKIISIVIRTVDLSNNAEC